MTFLVDNRVAFQLKIASIIFNGTFQEMIQNYDEARQILNILQIRPFNIDVKIMSKKIDFMKYTEYLNICKFLLILVILSTTEFLVFIYYNKSRRTRWKK